MTPLTMDYDYVVCDTDEWIADRTGGINGEATAAWETWREANPDGHESEALLTWLATLDATGYYNEGDPNQICTYNEENFLNEDFILTFANTDAYGTLFIHQHGYWTSGTPTIYAFNGDDDADAFGWASGYALCSMGGPYHQGYCDAEWIVESACTLWQNGGGQTERISDVIKRDDGDDSFAVCPRCHMGNLTFWAS